jgi:hypothetical protein
MPLNIHTAEISGKPLPSFCILFGALNFSLAKINWSALKTAATNANSRLNLSPQFDLSLWTQGELVHFKSLVEWNPLPCVKHIASISGELHFTPKKSFYWI